MSEPIPSQSRRNRKAALPGIPRRPRRKPETWDMRIVRWVLTLVFVAFFLLLAFFLSILLEEASGLELIYVLIFAIVFLLASWRMEPVINYLMDFFY